MTKQCFCIGPEKCNDGSCEIVKEHKKKQKNLWDSCKCKGDPSVDCSGDGGYCG